MPRITFKKDRITFEVEEGDWLYGVCQDARASIPFTCKAGACGTCATEVLEGRESMGDPRARETRTLE